MGPYKQIFECCFVFERAIGEWYLWPPCKAAGDKDQNSPAQHSGVARCLGQGDPGHPKDISSEVTQEWWLLCHEILNGFYAWATYHKTHHLGVISAHLHTSGWPHLNLLNKIQVVYLDYVFTMIYNVLSFPNWTSTVVFYQSLCQEYIINVQYIMYINRYIC